LREEEYAGDSLFTDELLRYEHSSVLLSKFPEEENPRPSWTFDSTLLDGGET
jgi:hypothetical protein